MMKFVLIVSYLAVNLLNANSVFADLQMTLKDTNKINQLQDDRVIGGREALMGEVPHQIALLANQQFICGGSLIRPNVVLTAAHCVYDSGFTNFTVRYNTLRYYSGPVIAVKKVLVHPNYNPLVSLENDIAILLLSINFVLDQNAKAIDFSQAVDPKPGSLVTVSGWGKTSSTGSISQALKVADLTVISSKECISKWRNGAKITNSMVCAVGNGRSACNGDSGGPLVQNGKLVGIVSFGERGCLNTHNSKLTLPNVYTKVISYSSWIWTTLSRYSGK